MGPRPPKASSPTRRPLERRPDTDAQDHQIGRELLAVRERDLHGVDAHELRAETEDDATLLMKPADRAADGVAEDAAEGHGLGGHHRDLDASRAE